MHLLAKLQADWDAAEAAAAPTPMPDPRPTLANIIGFGLLLNVPAVLFVTGLWAVWPWVQA